MEVLIQCLVFTFLFFLITINIWCDGSWSKKSFWYDPVSRFMMGFSFLIGIVSLFGTFVGLIEVLK